MKNFVITSLLLIQYSLVQSASMTDQKLYTVDSVVSADGVKIGYRMLGHGPGLILLHGTFESAQSHMELAQALSDSFTVFLPDRRGRGSSPYFTQEFDIQKDIDDLEVLIKKTNAHFVFAVSAGAIITLKAALSVPGIDKLAVWEPPLKIDTVKGWSMLSKYDNQIRSDKIADAMVTAMRAGKFVSPLFSILPRFILRSFTTKMMNAEESKATKEDVTMRMLAPTIHHDFKICLEMSVRINEFKNIKTRTLLVGGSKSPRYFRESLDALEKIVPHVRRVEFPGLSHGGSGSSQWGGKPDLVAQELARFFKEPNN